TGEKLVLLKLVRAAVWRPSPNKTNSQRRECSPRFPNQAHQGPASAIAAHVTIMTGPEFGSVPKTWLPKRVLLRKNSKNPPVSWGFFLKLAIGRG
ncbi:MAG: hypothetical protein ACXVBY_22640, partial [Isosphaeraceae bacterium]